MTASAREIFLISDLHLGGMQPPSNDPEDRGFRICTHGAALAQFVSALADKTTPVELIVNGDMVDFLAEEDDGGGWSAFTSDQQAAAKKLDAIIDRERPLFEAFGKLLERGHRLVLLLGNHDIELTLPAVRKRLADRIGVRGNHDYEFIIDGEAYVVGRTLIEHGNRYDPFNIVDYDGLRRVRSLLSRNMPVPDEYAFEAPAGSHMVVDVINPIKKEYRLIDLLKPETGAALPVLMALEPGYRKVLVRAAALSLKSREHRMASASMPSFAGDISSTGGDTWSPDGFASDISSSAPPPDALTIVLRRTMGANADLVMAAAPPQVDFAGDISTFDGVDRAIGMARMLLSSNSAPFDSRVPALLAAVRALQSDTTFARDAECFTEYLDAARALAKNGFDTVIFGHTHSARDVAMDAGARYLNSGTWADLIKFPSEILKGTGQQARDGLRAFVGDMGQGKLRAWTSFTPTYVKMTVGDDGNVRDVTLCDYTSPQAL